MQGVEGETLCILPIALYSGWYSFGTEVLSKYLLNENMNKYGRTPNSFSAPDSNFFLKSMRNPLFLCNNKFSISTRSSFSFFFF